MDMDILIIMTQLQSWYLLTCHGWIIGDKGFPSPSTCLDYPATRWQITATWANSTLVLFVMIYRHICASAKARLMMMAMMFLLQKFWWKYDGGDMWARLHGKIKIRTGSMSIAVLYCVMEQFFIPQSSMSIAWKAVGRKLFHYDKHSKHRKNCK